MSEVTEKTAALEIVRSALQKINTIGTVEDQEIDEMLTQSEVMLRKLIAKLKA